MRKPVQGFPIRQELLKIRRRSIFKNNNLFEIVKRNITTRQTAEAYGFQPNRSSMICCPFHADRNPSMKVDSRFHCFGCGADGDVIDFMMYILRRMEKYGLYREKRVSAAIRIVANENHYHPIRDYLNDLKWDGTGRISHALHRFLGAAEDELTAEALKIFLLGAIKRVFHPGC